MTIEEEYKSCLEWLESLDKYYIGEEEREYLEENFSNVEFNLVGVTSMFDEGEVKTPVQDYIDSIKYGRPLD